jgi:hypothetical protein
MRSASENFGPRLPGVRRACVRRFQPAAPCSGCRLENRKLAEQLLLSGGNLKKMGEDLGISHPTLRKRVDEMISGASNAAPRRR